VKGHSGDVGNDRADELVQWGKTPGPYSRIRRDGGGGEGEGRYQKLVGKVRDVEADVDTNVKELVLNFECSSDEGEPESTGGPEIREQPARPDDGAREDCDGDGSLAVPEELPAAPDLRQFFTPGIVDLERRMRGIGVSCEASSFELESRTIRVLRPNE